MSPETPGLLTRIAVAVGVRRVRTDDAQRAELNGARRENEVAVAVKLRQLADVLDDGLGR